MQVKFEFKVHRSVLFLDKNVDNLLGNKYLLSLGYDDQIDPTNGSVLSTALVFKIWDFPSLDSKCITYLTLFIDYIHSSQRGLTGGTVWDKAANDQMGLMTPIMYKIEFENKPYLDPVKKFAVSSDCVYASLVMHNNQILIYKVSLKTLNLNIWCRFWRRTPTTG
jgi:hypothetical protein